MSQFLGYFLTLSSDKKHTLIGIIRIAVEHLHPPHSSFWALLRMLSWGYLGIHTFLYSNESWVMKSLPVDTVLRCLDCISPKILTLSSLFILENLVYIRWYIEEYYYHERKCFAIALNAQNHKAALERSRLFFFIIIRSESYI